ncbi:hypothetical protein BGP_2738 [Beggiatoa sp. PS]|nr:hypothetical protein BGP_2738 [Beggiatoa sp. PS]
MCFGAFYLEWWVVAKLLSTLHTIHGICRVRLTHHPSIEPEPKGMVRGTHSLVGWVSGRYDTPIWALFYPPACPPSHDSPNSWSEKRIVS